MLLNCGVVKTLESALDCKEIQPVRSKGDQSWMFIGRTVAKAETPVLWPPHGKSWLIGKDSDAGRDWGQEEKGMTEDETAGWHHRLDGHEFEWTSGVGDGQGGLGCCNSRGCKESDTTERLNWTALNVRGRDWMSFSRWLPSCITTTYWITHLSLIWNVNVLIYKIKQKYILLYSIMFISEISIHSIDQSLYLFTNRDLNIIVINWGILLVFIHDVASWT